MTPQRESTPLNRLATTILCACLLISVGCEQEAPHDSTTKTPAAGTVPVQTVTVNETLFTIQNEVVGTVKAVQEATIAAKITGTITDMPVQLGSSVKQGDLLVKLSAAEIVARLSQAETAVNQAKRNLDREERLLAKNASTQETVNAHSDAYKLAKAAQNEASTMLGYVTIRAPFSGQISKKMADVGDLATVGTPLLNIENTDIVQAVAAIPEAQLAGIKPGDALTVRIPAANLETSGTVSEIAPTGDAASRTSLIKLNLTANKALRPGQFVRVILPGTSSKTLMVPESALSTYGQMERLFVVENNTANLRLIRTGSHRDGQIEILSGLNAGEQVIIGASDRLIDGQPVKVTP
ncbi:MAG: efflux RND transporter periplasmic adaptor subunit [Desulfobulbaceae bacterium]|nr:efflux RND transporter periplasmic adaptor subunit [Desulfobulbaceae bacterium]